MTDLTRRQTLEALTAASLAAGAAESQTAVSPICFMSALELAKLIRTRKLSARALVEAHLKRIEQINAKLTAIVTLVPELAIEGAAKSGEMQARKEKLGPLLGLPVAHKDL